MQVLDREQREFAERAEEVAADFADEAYTWRGDVPWENMETLADADLLCPSVSAEYGGQGISDVAAMLVTEAVGRVCPDTGWFTYMQSMVAPRAIDLFGSETVKEQYLPDVTSGEGHVSIAISEPEAGSDVGSMTTEVTEENGDLVCNGEKTWVGGIPFSDAAVTWVRFPEGLGSIVLDLTDPGVEVEREYTNMAGYSQTHFTIDDVAVPESHVLTRGEEAFKEQLVSLNWERLGVPSSRRRGPSPDWRRRWSTRPSASSSAGPSGRSKGSSGNSPRCTGRSRRRRRPCTAAPRGRVSKGPTRPRIASRRPSPSSTARPWPNEWSAKRSRSSVHGRISAAIRSNTCIA